MFDISNPPSPLLTTAFFTGMISLVLFAANIIWHFVNDLIVKNKRKRQIIESLFAEIRYNVMDLEKFLATSLSESDLRTAMSDNKELIPHITDARHVGVYNANITNLHMIEDGVIPDIIEFYASLDNIKSQIDGTQLLSYRTISVSGRIAVIMQIVAKTRDACRIGRRILTRIEHSSPAGWHLPRAFGNEPRRDDA